MTISVTESDDENEVTIHISGRFDFSCHQLFADGYRNYSKGEMKFVVDLAETEDIDSSAMGMLLQLRGHSSIDEGGVSLINANESVQEILKTANFHKLFNVPGIE